VTPLYSAAFFSAQLFFCARAIFFLVAALNGFRSLGADSAAVTASGFFGGLPRRLTVPVRASIARFSLSRSAMRRARMWSVGIERIVG
jgi:hypothetical protein